MHIQRNKKIIKSEKKAYAVVSNNSRDLWSEVRKVKGRNSKISRNVDGSCDSKEITELFTEKYKHLYNSVPYNIDDMHAIESTIFERLHNCENVKYVISHSDVINALSHLKKLVNQMGLRVYFMIIFFMVLIDFTLFYLFNTPCFYCMVLAQIQ